MNRAAIRSAIIDNSIFVLLGFWIGAFLFPFWPGWTIVFFGWMTILTVLINEKK